MRDDARAMARAAIDAVEPAAAVRKHASRDGDRLRCGDTEIDLDACDRLLVVGAGKAGAAMASALDEILGDRIDAGTVVVPHGAEGSVGSIRLLPAAHPIPDEAGADAGTAVLELVAGADQGDLVICLISGGGSALLVRPADGIDLADLAATSEALLACGATIVEINTLRKHLSSVKGGQLARAAAPARVMTMVLSDVVGDPLDAIASGPTYPDRTTFQDCLEIVRRYEVRDKLPRAVIDRIDAGGRGELAETPKPGDPVFERVDHVIVGNNDQAVTAAASVATERGYTPCVLSTTIEGETREVAKVHAAIAREARHSGRPVRPPACLISGGETTVTLKGKGRGGRNQEFVLAAALELQGEEGVLVCSVGTDGIDGPTDAAGAVADGASCERAADAGLDPRALLDANDSYRFFEALDDLVVTGPTGTNVMDLRLLLIR